MSSLAGKSVIVTGSSSGIGLATAVLFASKGSNVTVCGRDAGRCDEAVKACEEAAKESGKDNKVISVLGDICDSAVIKNTVEKTVEAFGKLDVLVVNHGVAMRKGNESIETWTKECFEQSMQPNVSAVIELIKAAVPYLEKEDVRGNIVCVSSMGSKMPLNTSMNYIISKGALDHMVRCLALQLGPKGVRINATNPTYVPSRLGRELEPELKAMEGILEPLHDSVVPLQGQKSGPEEQAEVIAFLASDAARLVHGQCISVDGGMGLKGTPLNFPAVISGFVAQMQQQQS